MIRVSFSVLNTDGPQEQATGMAFLVDGEDMFRQGLTNMKSDARAAHPVEQIQRTVRRPSRRLIMHSDIQLCVQSGRSVTRSSGRREEACSQRRGLNIVLVSELEVSSKAGRMGMATSRLPVCW